jgi:hypothetical protein
MRSAAWCVGVLCAGALLHGCARPPVNTALVVRNLESKCAWIAFSGCEAFAVDRDRDRDHDHAREDAGSRGD